MANTSTSTNMSMPVPVVGTDPGPSWADDLNACLAILDVHSHAAGSGVPITPDGINVNADFPMGNQHVTNFKSVRFQVQSAVLSGPSNVGCLYSVGVDLYFNDGSGNQIRITQSAAVAGTPGSISSLSSPASASYSSGSGTFVWQSAASTPANLDAGFIILRNNSASSFGCTLYPPTAMGSNFSLILPSLPASTKIVTLDSSGNFGATYGVDGSTLQVSSSVLSVKDAGISAAKLASDAVTTAKILDANVTRAKQASVGQQLSSSCSTFHTTAGSFVDVTNLTVTITSTGRPVIVALIADGSSSPSQFTSASGVVAQMKLLRDATLVSIWFIGQTTVVPHLPPMGVIAVDPVGAGTYVYKVQMSSSDGDLNYMKLVAYEL